MEKLLAVMVAIEGCGIAFLIVVLKVKDSLLQQAKNEADQARREAEHFKSALVVKGKSNEELDRELRDAGILDGSSIRKRG